VKVTSLVLLLCLATSIPLPAGEKGWSGSYTDNKYLNGEAVFQLNILQEGDSISVDFDAAYKDGHGCAPEASGPAKAADKNTLKFTFTDSFDNSGTGTIKRVADGVILSVETTRVADSRCVVFYKAKIPLSAAH
jgi:hypothetical protein